MAKASLKNRSVRWSRTAGSAAWNVIFPSSTLCADPRNTAKKSLAICLTVIRKVQFPPAYKARFNKFLRSRPGEAPLANKARDEREFAHTIGTYRDDRGQSCMRLAREPRTGRLNWAGPASAVG